MKLIQSPKRFRSARHQTPHTVTLHHTAGSLKGSEDYSINVTHFGYHFMIDRDGTVYAYNPVTEEVAHSLEANTGYIGVAFIAGGTELGPVQQNQYQAAVELLTKLQQDYGDTLKYVTDHATIDVLVSGRCAKSDPQWAGEHVDQNNWDIKHHYIDMIANDTGLLAIKTDGKISIGANNEDTQE
jgi:N-acetyl-anhydromuramyl-L-alanine amidase AmpD